MVFTFFVTGLAPDTTESTFREVLSRDTLLSVAVRTSDVGTVAQIDVGSMHEAKQIVAKLSDGLLRRSVRCIRRDSALGHRLANLFAAAEQSSRRTCKRQALSSACLLVVDDDPMALQGMEGLVSVGLPNACVHVANSGDSALHLNEAQEFDAVLSDVQMPGMNGFALVATLKRLRPHTPVVLMSGEPQAHAVMVSSGAFGFMRKPVDRQSCCSALDHAVRYHALSHAVSQAESSGQDCAEMKREMIELAERERAESMRR